MKVVKKVSKYVLVFIGLIAIYVVMLFVTSLIPSNWLKENVTSSSELLKELGESYKIDFGVRKDELFLFTDALMINTAYSIDNTNPIESMLLDRKSYIPGQTKIVHEEGIDVQSPKMYMEGSNTFQTRELYGLMHNDNNTEAYEYPRYWHGYLVILRILLLLFDYSIIRILSFIVFILLFAWFIILLAKKVNIVSSIIFLFGFISINIFFVSLSLNEITTFYIAIILSIILLLFNKKIQKHVEIIFFVTGSITCFLDLFTTPVISLGIPLIVYFLMLQENNMNLRKQITLLFKLCILWGLGYGLTWTTKWVLTDVLLGKNILTDAISQIAFRTGADKIPIILKIKATIYCLANKYGKMLIAINLFIATLIGIIGLIKYKNKKINYANVVPFFIIATFPIIYFSVVWQHSSFHLFFTFRIFVITVIAFMLIISNITGYKNKNCEIK